MDNKDSKEYVVTEVKKYVNKMDEQPSDSIQLLSAFLAGANVIRLIQIIRAMEDGLIPFSAGQLAVLIGGIGISMAIVAYLMLEKIKVNNQLKEFVKNQIEAMGKETQIEGKQR